MIGSARQPMSFVSLILALLLSVVFGSETYALNSAKPKTPVKLVFIHHSVGENWLSDGNGNLGRILGQSNYFISDTNYGWGPEGIGDRTDILNWSEWFTGSRSSLFLKALYKESGTHSSYTRTLPDPGGENQIVMFKSCFPNSQLGGKPSDPPSQAQDLTVGHAKHVYNRLLQYFRTRPDKLFIVITAPPVQDATQAANARTFNRWLVKDWLKENNYPHANVAVWNFHAVLSHPGNHHQLRNGRVEHVDTIGRGTLHYDSNGDDHPSAAGNRKATAEFVPMLNVFYNRWQAGMTGGKHAAARPSEALTRTRKQAQSQPEAQATPTVAPASAPEQTAQRRAFPDTTNGIHVFNDQLSNLTEAQRRFVTTHYAGTQKMKRSDADHLRALNPGFLILHYRLGGLGLGYRAADGNCNPTGEHLQIINGDWVQEWPGDATVRPEWFYKHNGQRVFMCEWSWYLMDLDNTSWRKWWSTQVLAQMAANDADGLFADSMSVPNYFGGSVWKPALPEVGKTFEVAWTARIEKFIAYAQSRFGGRYYFIPNVGAWITSRNTTDYSGADGVMIEGFGYDTWKDYGESDWALQMNRALGLTNQNRIIIAQPYSHATPRERMFSLASYLLIKGKHSFINIDTGTDPEWWPEYETPVGSPVDGLPSDVAALRNAKWGVYARRYSNALVLVNASQNSVTLKPDGKYFLARPTGGGNVPENGQLPANWTVNYTEAANVTLEPGSAAVLVKDPQQATSKREASATTPAPQRPASQAQSAQPSQPQTPGDTPPQPVAKAPAGTLVTPADFIYLGAFRLPLDEDEENSFAWGGHAMTFRADGDPAGASDGFPGSLFLTGHPYQLPKGRQVAEISIPAPVNSKDPNSLPKAEILQPLQNVTGETFAHFNELPRVGLQYLNDPSTGAKMHIAFGQHMGSEVKKGTHGVFDPTLSHPSFKGPWHIAGHSTFSVNGYLFEIPKEWADKHTGGRVLATGRFRDGGWSGMGPTVLAYKLRDESGAFPKPGAQLNAAALLKYQSSEDGMDLSQMLKNYQHADSWEGGAWLTTSTGKTAVLFAGTKGVGAKYWYGFANPKGAQFPCVHDGVAQKWKCMTAGGGHCPEQDYVECTGHDDSRGWWSSRFEAQFILYNPADLAEVASGRKKPYEPQPYAVVTLDKHLFLNSQNAAAHGVGDQRHHRISSVAYDRRNDLLYVLEPHADGAKPIVHVWRAR